MVLVSISQYPDVGYAGLMVGLDDGKNIVTGLNNRGVAAGVTDLAFAAVNLATYTFQAYGINVSFTADGSATAAEIRDGLKAAAEAIPALAALMTFTASGSDLRLTERAATNGSMALTGLDANTTATVVTAHEQTEPMAAGILVAAGPGFQDIRLMATALDRIAGFTVHQHNPVNEVLYPSPSTVNYPANSEVSVAKRGSMWVKTEQAIDHTTDVPFARFTATASNPQLGAIRKDADTGKAVDISDLAKFVTSQPTVGGLVLVSFQIL